MSTKMAASQPGHFSSRGKLPESCLAGPMVQDICTCDLKRHVCGGGVPQDKPTGKCPSCHQGCQDTYQETQKGEVHYFQGITEVDFRSLLR